MNKKFTRHLESNILNDDQCRKNQGTQTALTILYENFALSQKEKERWTLVCIDISKAFDKVWIKGLRYRILNLNLPEPVEKILCSFLEGRTAKIRICEYVCPSLPLLSGVPQGSILSPTLSILYTANLNEPIYANNLDLSFADDITNNQISVSIKNVIGTEDTKRN